MVGNAMKIQAIALAVLISAASQAQVLLFDDFESPSVSPEPPGLVLYSTGESFGGWTVTSGNVELINPQFEPSMGQIVDLVGFSPGQISRSLLTDAGMRYEVSFQFRGSTGDSFDESRVSWGGSDYTWRTRNIGITTVSLVVTGTGADTLSFAGLSSFAHMINDVRVAQVSGDTPLTPVGEFFTNVPEPHEYAMVAAVGLLGFAAYRRRHATA